ncbi:MAG TPA: nucleotidyl transferase AbiEii/AbiGii toxin family protein [Ignavibacteria bacterium]
MKKEKQIKNLPASVKQRLINLCGKSGIEFQNIMRQYIQERFLYRLSISKYTNDFILKGALLFLAHNIDRTRPTKDIDFLGNSISNKNEDIKRAIIEILSINYEDGLLFDNKKIDVVDIINDGDYQGIRIKFDAYLQNARERIQIDIGFGDEITSGPVELDFPTLLDFPAPRLFAYSLESALAEKFEAIVSINLATSRMKDFYDIAFLAKNCHFEKTILREALFTTFNNRKTDIENRKEIFSDDFKNDSKKQIMWSAFLKRNKLDDYTKFIEIVEKIKTFIEPVFENNNKNKWNPVKLKWVI